MIKLIACDLDGTVLDDNKNIDSGLKEVVDKLKEKVKNKDQSVENLLMMKNLFLK